MIRTCLLVLSLTVAAACFAAGEASAVQLTASWTDNSGGEATTRLERRPQNVVAFAAIADVPPGVTAYVDTSVSAGTTYCYRIAAYDDVGASPYSAEACATPGNDGSSLDVAVKKVGVGTGTIASTPAGILCGSNCAATYPAGTPVTLSATAATGSTFTGWNGGGCAGTAPCTVAGNARVAVAATFTAATKSIAVSKAGDVTGTIVSSPAGIQCGTTCFATYSANTTVTLTANPAAGSTFTGWGGACGGTGTCTVNGSGATSVTATFSSTANGDETGARVALE